MDEISNDGMNSELEDDDDEEEDFQLNQSFNQMNNIRIKSCFNNNNTNTDDDLIFNNSTISATTSITNACNLEVSKRKKLNSNKYCKKRKCRTTFTKSQLITLENEFLKSNFVSNDRIDLLIDMTGLDSRIIKNWFKNKRSRVLADTKSTNSTTSNLINKLDASTFNLKMEKLTELNLNQLTPSSVADSNSPSSMSSHSNHNQLFVQTSIFTLKETEKVVNTIKTNFIPTLENSITVDSNKTQSNGLLNILTTNPILNHEINEHKLALNKIGYSPPITSNVYHKPQQLHQQPPHPPKLVINEVSRKLNVNDLKDTNCNVCSNSPKLFCVCDVSKSALNRLYRTSIGFNSFNETHNSFTRQRNNNNDANQLLIETESKLFEIL